MNTKKNIVCRIDWTREDIASVLEEAGSTATDEDIDRFIENFDWESFREKMIRDGFEMLDFGI